MKRWLYSIALVGTASLSLLGISALSKSSSQAQTPARPAPVEQFIVRGAEPFWNVTINRNGIVYTTPETKQSFPLVAPIAAQGRPLDVVRVYRLKGANNLLVIKKVDACSDTMSDTKYPYSATLILGNTVREGCAEKK